jgi:hypothetical protein
LRSAGAWLAALVAVSALLRIALAALVHGPWIFSDELGYARLAQSIGQTGHLALFDKPGLSYSPLYPAVLAPLYAFHLSAPEAYRWILIVNCILMSFAAIPIYRIARFVLSPGLSLAAAGVCSLAPLMFYTSIVFSENLAYPLFLCAVWAMLVAVRSPSVRHDVVLLLAILLAGATRIQLVVLLPAAFCAVLLGALTEPSSGTTRSGATRQRLLLALRRHWPVSFATALFTVGVVAAFAGTGLQDVAGRYQNVRTVPLTSPGRVAELTVEHLAGLDLAVGVIPFAAALVAAYIWLRHGARPDRNAFAVVALPVTVLLLLETGVVAFFGTLGVDLPRIHERYLFYLVPLFVIALLAHGRRASARTVHPAYLTAIALSGLLPALIPFKTVINNTIVADSFALQAFGRDAGNVIEPIANARLAAVGLALSLAALGILLQRRPVAVVVLVIFVFFWMSAMLRVRIDSAASGAAVLLPAHRDWVDRAAGGHDVVLVAGPRTNVLAARETAFNNLTVARVLYTCLPTLEHEFGEQQVHIDPRGLLHDTEGTVKARAAVVPAGSGVEGRVVARAPRAGLVLVELLHQRLQVGAGQRFHWRC